MDLSTTFHPSPSQGRAPSAIPSLPQPAGLPSSALAPLSLCLLPEARPPLLLVGHADDAIRLYSLEDGEGHETRLLRAQEGHKAEVSALAPWSRDGESWIVSASLDRTLRRWKLAGPSSSHACLSLVRRASSLLMADSSPRAPGRPAEPSGTGARGADTGRHRHCGRFRRAWRRRARWHDGRGRARVGRAHGVRRR
jgi:WD40 repeat protein